jgi:hypothetical protein
MQVMEMVLVTLGLALSGSWTRAGNPRCRLDQAPVITQPKASTPPPAGVGATVAAAPAS